MKSLLEEISLQSNRKLNLDEMIKLDGFFDFPSKKFKTIHIAGTNGKGSVTTKIACALCSSGYKTGLYTSPHISSFNERIKINGKKISAKKLEKYFAEVYRKAKENLINPNFFEIMTIVAFRFFAEKKVDFAVIETGLGGRLDATNIITPLLSVITSISFDHTYILGNTLEKIAFEKAGIIKPNVPVLVGPEADFASIRKKAKESGSLLIKSKKIERAFDAQNSEIAKDALFFLKEKFSVKEEAIKTGVTKRPECRFELYFKKNKFFQKKNFPKALILDVAHNPDGLKNLFAAAKGKFPLDKFRVVLGISKNKDIKTCIEEILKYSSHVHLIDGHERLISKEDLFEMFPKNDTLKVLYKLSFAKELKRAIMLAQKKNEVLIVCGSFFIMQPIKEALGLKNR